MSDGSFPHFRRKIFKSRDSRGRGPVEGSPTQKRGTIGEKRLAARPWIGEGIKNGHFARNQNKKKSACRKKGDL